MALCVEPGLADVLPGLLVADLSDQAVHADPQVGGGVGGAVFLDPVCGDRDGSGEPQRDPALDTTERKVAVGLNVDASMLVSAACRGCARR